MLACKRSPVGFASQAKRGVGAIPLHPCRSEERKLRRIVHARKETIDERRCRSWRGPRLGDDENQHRCGQLLEGRQLSALTKGTAADNRSSQLRLAHLAATRMLEARDWQGLAGEIARTGEEDPLALVDDPDLKAVIAAKMYLRRSQEASMFRDLGLE
jgi:hypothetical protein